MVRPKIEGVQPQVESQELYVQIRDDVADQIIQRGLSKTESKLFFYLLKLDRSPEDDEFVDLNASKVIADCGMSKAAFSRAKNRLQELGLFEFQKRRTVINFLMEKE